VENLAATTYGSAARRGGGVADRMNEPHESEILRPLEDPYLVGEVAAAKARRERLARENGDDILIREDRQWDWMLCKYLAQNRTRRHSPPSPPEPPFVCEQ
jgi:hypothetical protein